MKFRPAQTLWEAYAALPIDIKEKAREAFRRFQDGAADPPFHLSLRTLVKNLFYPELKEPEIFFLVTAI